MIGEGMSSRVGEPLPEQSLFGIHKRIESARGNAARILRLLDGVDAALFGDKIDIDQGIRGSISGGAGAIRVTYHEAELTDDMTNEVEVRLGRLIDRLEIRGSVESRMKGATEVK